MTGIIRYTVFHYIISDFQKTIGYNYAFDYDSHVACGNQGLDIKYVFFSTTLTCQETELNRALGQALVFSTILISKRTLNIRKNKTAHIDHHLPSRQNYLTNNISLLYTEAVII